MFGIAQHIRQANAVYDPGLQLHLLSYDMGSLLNYGKTSRQNYNRVLTMIEQQGLDYLFNLLNGTGDLTRVEIKFLHQLIQVLAADTPIGETVFPLPLAKAFAKHLQLPLPELTLDTVLTESEVKRICLWFHLTAIPKFKHGDHYHQIMRMVGGFIGKDQFYYANVRNTQDFPEAFVQDFFAALRNGNPIVKTKLLNRSLQMSLAVKLLVAEKSLYPSDHHFNRIIHSLLAPVRGYGLPCLNLSGADLYAVTMSSYRAGDKLKLPGLYMVKARIALPLNFMDTDLSHAYLKDLIFKDGRFTGGGIFFNQVIANGAVLDFNFDNNGVIKQFEVDSTTYLSSSILSMLARHHAIGQLCLEKRQDSVSISEKRSTLEILKELVIDRLSNKELVEAATVVAAKPSANSKPNNYALALQPTEAESFFCPNPMPRKIQLLLREIIVALQQRCLQKAAELSADQRSQLQPLMNLNPYASEQSLYQQRLDQYRLEQYRNQNSTMIIRYSYRL